LWQFRVRNFFSITIICLSFLILGVFLSLSNNLQHIAQELSRNMVVVFSLDKDLPAKEISQIEQQIKQSPFVTKVKYVSTEEALSRFQKNFPELQEIINNLNTNPFPPSFEATLEDKAAATDEILSFINEMTRRKGIEDVQYNRAWVEKVQSLGRLAKAVGFFLGGILILASFFIISNVIKLNVFSRKNEIEILRLVGATNTFIRIPFLLEGILLGLMGSLISLLLLFFLIQLFPLYLGSSLGALQELLGFRYLSFSQSVGLLAGGAIIGSMGSLSSLSRFLKV
jgi:cell division transport system permease protein